MAIYSRIDPLTPDEIADLDINDVNIFDRGAVSPNRETEAGNTPQGFDEPRVLYLEMYLAPVELPEIEHQ